jgi:LmbE family N-acetylglucosaminyl deacetylase
MGHQESTLSETYIPESAMAIYAHPDDIEFSCGGTLARWAKEGARISYVIVTNGDVGIADPSISRKEGIQIRRSEAQAAAKIAGATEVVVLDERDGEVQVSMDLRKRLVREIRRFKPEVVLTHDPSVIIASDTYLNHPDHRAVGTTAIDAIFPAAGQPNLFESIEQEEGFKAHKPRKVYFSSRTEATVFVNIESTIDLKIAALRAHKSQMLDWDPEEGIKQWAGERGSGKEMKYAEGFRVVALESDEDWELSKGDPLILEAERRKKMAEKEAQKDAEVE